MMLGDKQYEGQVATVSRQIGTVPSTERLEALIYTSYSYQSSCRNPSALAVSAMSTPGP